MFFPPVFLVREKAIETNNPRTTNALPELKERERKRFIKRRRETERDLVLSRRKKEERYVVSFPPLLLKRLRRYPHQREACRFGKQKSIDPIVSLLPKKKKKKKKKEGKRICEKTKERRIKTLLTMLMRVCVCVLFLLLCPRLNVRLQMCVDELCCFTTKFYPKSGSSLREKSYSKRKLQKKNIKQPTTVADKYSHKSSSSSVDVHGYTKTLT